MKKKIFRLIAFLCPLLLLLILLLAFLLKPHSPVLPLPANMTDGRFKLGEEMAFFNNEKVAALTSPLAEILPQQNVLSASSEERWVEVDLAKQRLYAHEGDKIIYEFPVSTGKWAATPTGEFRIWAKLKYTLMHGGNPATNTYYYLPNVPYTQYFYQGYGLHGTYWHNNFGHPMSHGCVNMYTPDAQTLFYWTSPPATQDQWTVYPTQDSPGTRVVVHGTAPAE